MNKKYENENEWKCSEREGKCLECIGSREVNADGGRERHEDVDHLRGDVRQRQVRDRPLRAERQSRRLRISPSSPAQLHSQSFEIMERMEQYILTYF